MSDLKTSLLINRQVPEFIREEYPLFISFLEAYYEYLETKQGVQINDLVNKSKDLRYLSDVDYSIDEFEDSFFNTFASLIPKNTEVSKEFLIKNVLPLYLSKGSESSFKFLFRLIFDEDIQLKYPKDNILRASDGKWTVDNILRIEKDVRSVYTGNGTQNEFLLTQSANSDEIRVFVNGVLQTENVDYVLRKEAKKVIFNVAPVLDSKVEVFYSEFNIDLLTNRKVTGRNSGASAIVERATSKIITDRLNIGFPFELFIDLKTLSGTFETGEIIETDIIGVDGSIINIEADSFSIVTRIDVTNPGASYNIGDPVTVLGGNFKELAVAEVSEINSHIPRSVLVQFGGAGFQTNANVRSTSTITVNGFVDLVNTSTGNTQNTYSYNNDVIGNFASVLISSSDYGFPSTVIPGGENVSTRIADALSFATLTNLGTIQNVSISLAGVTTSNSIFLDANSPTFSVNSNVFEIKSFGSIGRIEIANSGINYRVGDEINFITPQGNFGRGAAATVAQVDGSGRILRIQIEPPRVSGTASISNNATTIAGTGTAFGSEIRVGDRIVIRGQERIISSIASATGATVNVAFTFRDGTTSVSGAPIGAYAAGTVGGVNYDQRTLPSLTVTSAAGTGANLIARAVMGDGEILRALAYDFVEGQILKIKVISGGAGYEYNPVIDLTSIGNGSASANAEVSRPFISLPGRWRTSDSIISTSERKLQGANYYIDYSYVISSVTQFSRYKELLKQLLHPAGFTYFSNLLKQTQVDTNTTVTISTVANTLSGLVNVTSGSVFVNGTNTKFNIANTRGIMTIGSNVSVNGEIRTISSIISNTNVKVSSAFTNTANAQTVIILA